MGITPLRLWLAHNNLSITAMARKLGTSRACAQFWVRGETMPRGYVLEKLLALTRLKLRELVPDPHLQELRRLRLAALKLKPVPIKVRPQRSGPKRKARKKGATRRGARATSRR